MSRSKRGERGGGGSAWSSYLILNGTYSDDCFFLVSYLDYHIFYDRWTIAFDDLSHTIDSPPFLMMHLDGQIPIFGPSYLIIEQ